MPKHTKYIYRKVELGSLINKETLKEEIDLDMELEYMMIAEMKIHTKI